MRHSSSGLEIEGFGRGGENGVCQRPMEQWEKVQEGSHLSLEKRDYFSFFFSFLFFFLLFKYFFPSRIRDDVYSPTEVWNVICIFFSPTTTSSSYFSHHSNPFLPSLFPLRRLLRSLLPM